MATAKQVIEGLQILSRYGDPQEHDICAEHDIIYACPGVGPKDPSTEELQRLEDLGWFWDDQVDSWARFT